MQQGIMKKRGRVSTGLPNQVVSFYLKKKKHPGLGLYRIVQFGQSAGLVNFAVL